MISPTLPEGVARDRELLLTLNRRLTSGYEVAPDVNLPSVYGKAPLGDFGDKTFTSAATAVWLTRSAPALFTAIWDRYLDQPSPGAPSPADLSARLLQTMQTELRGLPNPQQATLLSRLMASIAGPAEPQPIAWADELRGLVDAQAAFSSGMGIEAPLVRWMVEIELDSSHLSLARRTRSFRRLSRRNGKKLKYWDLNNWAYLLLNLDLSRSATPLAVAAVERQRWSGSLDTLGWALFHEGNHGAAERHLLAAHREAEPGSEEWAEIGFHRAQVSFWQGDLATAGKLVDELEADAPESLWTRRASRLLLHPGSPAERGDARRNYDVALSFASEDREHARLLAELLELNGRRVFYDDYRRADLWGEDLEDYLTDVYRNQAEWCVVFVSRHYLRSKWTRQELRAARARALVEDRPYLLPVRLDRSELPGVLPTTTYVDLDRSSIEEISRMLISKIETQVA